MLYLAITVGVGIIFFIVGFVIARSLADEKIGDLEEELENSVPFREIFRYLMSLMTDDPGPGISQWNGCLQTVLNWLENR